MREINGSIHSGFNYTNPDMNINNDGEILQTNSSSPDSTGKVAEQIPPENQSSVQGQTEPAEHKNFIDRLFKKSVATNVGHITLGKEELADVKDDLAKNGVPLDKKTFKAVESARKEAASAMKSLDKLKGKELAKAFNNTKVPFEKSAAGKTFLKAMNAQLALAEKLDACSLASGGVARLDELSMRANLRAAELTRLVGELGDALAKGEQDARLEQKGLSSDLARIATESHGTREAVAFLEKTFAPQMQELEVFAGPDKNLSPEQVARFEAKVMSLKTAIADARTKGIDFRGDGSRVLVDPSVFASLEKTLTRLHGNLQGHQQRFVKQALLKMAEGVKMPCLDWWNGLTDLQKHDIDKFPPVMDFINQMRNMIAEYINTGDIEFLETVDKALQYGPNEDANSAVGKFRHAILQVSSQISQVGRQGHFSDEQIAGFKKAYTTFDKFQNTLDGFRHALTQIRHARERFLGTDPNNSGGEALMVRSADILNLMDGTKSVSDVVEARVLGFPDEAVDPEISGREPVSGKPLGQGAFNAVTLVTFNGPGNVPTQRVFKPENPGWIGMEHGAATKINNKLGQLQTVVAFNRASHGTAALLGCGSVISKAHIGHMNGEFGMFLEVAPGAAPSDVHSKPDKTLGEGGTTKAELAKLAKTDPQRYATVRHKLAQQLNQLQWMDVINGQCDRHNKNYHIFISKDFSQVRVTGIDNDQSFITSSTEVGKFTLGENAQTRLFDHLRCNVFNMDEKAARKALDDAEASGAIHRDPTKKTMQVDLTKIDARLRAAFCKGAGMYNISIPSHMDRGLFEKLAYFNGHEDEFRAELAKHGMTKEQIDAATGRMKSAYQMGVELDKDGLVFDEVDWENDDTFTRLKEISEKERSTYTTLNLPTRESNVLESVGGDMFFRSYIQELIAA